MNDIFLFPFESVERNSRIVGYGFGKVGKSYWLQLNKSKYCEVVLWVDKAGGLLSTTLVEIEPVHTLYELEDDKYDYVLIAIDCEPIALKIKEELIDCGIKEEKIICSSNRGVNDCQLYDNSISLMDEMKSIEWGLYLLWKRTTDKANGYYEQFLNAIYKNKDNKCIFMALKRMLRNMEASPERLIILRKLYDLEIYDDECMKLFMQTLYEMEWFDDTPFYLSMDSSHMIHYGIAAKCIYPDFYKDYRKLLIKICEVYNLKTPAHKKEFKPVKRVAVFGFRLDFDHPDAAMDLVTHYAGKLVEEGYVVKLFITNLVRQISDRECFLEKKYILPTSSYEEAKQRNLPYEFYFAEEDNVKDRMQMFTDRVFDFNPDLILDMSDDFCPQVYSIQKCFPVISIPMRGGKSGAFFDYVIEGDKEDFAEKNKIFRFAEERQSLVVKLANILDVEKTIQYEREKLGFGENDFIIVTVGSRLRYEVSNELIIRMCKLLCLHKNMRWLFVGEEIFSIDEQYSKLLKEGRIINWGWENHLEALYKICDVYLEPLRNGGAHGMRLAMREGLPIVISDYLSDGRWLFGEKRLCKDEKDMVEEIAMLYSDVGYYKKKADESVEIIKNLTRKSDCKKVVDAYLRAINS